MTDHGPGVRYVPAIAAGKLARVAMRMRGGGSAIPGRVANAIAPSLLQSLAGQFPYGVVIVLGSNGKTTTTHMVSEILRAHGLKVFTNPTGANMPQGVTSALLADATLTGRIDADVAVIEVDEGVARQLSTTLAPRVVLTLNVQQDQLYRYFETERVADMLLDAAKQASGCVIVNRDDPYLSKIETSTLRAPVSYFGAAPDLVARAAHGLANAADTRSGVVGAYAHDAHAEVLAFSGREATIRIGEATFTATVPARGLHYAVDAAAASAAAAAALGDRFDPSRAAAGISGMEPAYGRGESLPLRENDDDRVEFVMFKNWPSLQMNLDAVEEPPERLMIAVDEGTPDLSWLYSADLGVFDHVDVVSGTKAYQLATRLAYLDIPVGLVEPDLAKAVAHMRSLPPAASGSQNWFMNYETMMIGRRLLGHGDTEVARR